MNEVYLNKLIADLKEKMSQASHGPYRNDNDEYENCIVDNQGNFIADTSINITDSNYILAACNSVPALIAEIEKLRSMLDAAVDVVDDESCMSGNIQERKEFIIKHLEEKVGIKKQMIKTANEIISELAKQQAEKDLALLQEIEKLKAIIKIIIATDLKSSSCPPEFDAPNCKGLGHDACIECWWKYIQDNLIVTRNGEAKTDGSI